MFVKWKIVSQVDDGKMQPNFGYLTLNMDEWEALHIKELFEDVIRGQGYKLE